MLELWTYQYEITKVADTFHASAIDIPEAIASGEDIEAVRVEMERALIAVVKGRIKLGLDLDIPKPASITGEIESFTLPAELAAKATVYAAWKASGLSKVAFAAKLDCAEKEARRILDPDYRTSLDRMAEAARVLGRHLVVGFRAAA